MRLFKDSILFSVREKQASKYVFPSELEGCEFESKLCAFTGYRPQKLGVYSESDVLCLSIKAKLRAEIFRALNSGCRDFITGMALGVDTWAAEAVLQTQATYRKCGEEIRLHAAVPFIGQEKRWEEQDKRRYRRILKKCDRIFIISEDAESDAFLRRNDFMTSRAGLLIAVFDGKPGGTAYTVASAMRNEKEVRIIDPESIVAV